MAADLLSGARNRLLGCGRQARALWSDWAHLVLLGAQIIVLALTPSSYRSGRPRQTILRHIYLAMAPLLTWFLVLSTLVSLVLIRIVVATAVSYGLQYGVPLNLYLFLLDTDWPEYETTASSIFEHVFATLLQFGLRPFQWSPVLFADETAANQKQIG